MNEREYIIWDSDDLILTARVVFLDIRRGTTLWGKNKSIYHKFYTLDQDWGNKQLSPFSEKKYFEVFVLSQIKHFYNDIPFMLPV